MVNILFSCAGRRNYLIGYFREALAGRGEVMAADVSASAPAMHEADRSFLVPPITHPDYLETLLGICRDHQVHLLFSLNDLELPFLARHREEFQKVGTMAVVSSPEVVDLCFDKLKTMRWLKQIGLPAPRTFTQPDEITALAARGEISFPLVIKPRWGTASIGSEYPESVEELNLAWRLGRLRLMRSFLAEVSATDEEHALLIQEKLGGTEYTLDIINDFDGRYVKTFVKRKLAMRIGEGAVKAMTVVHPDLEALGRRIGESLGHIGALDCDVFQEGDRFSVIDLNPRFGGSYPFIHVAGVNLPAVMIAWTLGEPVAPEWLTLHPGISSAKCDRLVIVGREDVCRPSLSSLPSEPPISIQVG